jgi:hypothetical protein
MGTQAKNVLAEGIPSRSNAKFEYRKEMPSSYLLDRSYQPSTYHLLSLNTMKMRLLGLREKSYVLQQLRIKERYVS